MLLALLVAATAMSAAQAQEPSWQDVGIDPAEAQEWIASGVPFAGWANQWKGEGFGPRDARIWVERRVNVYTAAGFRTAGFSAAEATQWIEHGVRSDLRAKEFRDLGFSPDAAGQWWRLEFFPDEAAIWRDERLSPVDALAWKYGDKEYLSDPHSRSYSRPVYSVEWVRQWRSAGFTPTEARLAESYDVGFDEAREWLQAGFRLDEAVTWKDAGFGPTDAAREKASGFTPVEAEERRTGGEPARDAIASFHSDITLRRDATVDVTETIVVSNRPGGPVDRCFARTFPGHVVLRRSPSTATSAWPSYQFASVLRNGVPAAYTVERHPSGDVTLCIGGDEARVPRGEHTYAIHYTTDDRLIELRDHDRFFFDVMGSDLKMAVGRASADVHLPQGANTVRADGFAGPPNRKSFTANVTETAGGDVIAYTATRPLRNEMDFQVAVSVPRGVAAPSLMQRLRRLDRAAGRILSSLVFFIAGLAAALVYFVFAWHRVGRDPKRGAVVPVYDPPGGVSPALMRYLVSTRRIDGRTLVATLVRLAQQGWLVIRERGGRYRVEKTGKAIDGCAAHEAAFVAALFGETRELVLGTADGQRRLNAARRAFRNALRRERRAYIAAHTRYIWPGPALMIAGAVPALGIVDFADPDASSAYTSALGLIVAAVSLIFWQLVKAPTVRAQKLFDDIEGFRRFLDASYATRADLGGTASMNAPSAMTAHLPYAIAFGLDTERISILDRRPWYSGKSGGFSAADFTASLQRMTPRAVQS